MFEKIKDIINSEVKDERKKQIYLNKIDYVENFNLENDSITVTEYKDLKFYLSQIPIVEYNKFLDSVKTENISNFEFFEGKPILNELYWINTNLHLLSSSLSKVLKLEKSANSKIEKDAIELFKTRLNIFIPLADKVYKMKENIGKIKKETKSDIIKKEVEQIKGKLDERLEKILTEIGENFRIDLEKDYINYFKLRLDNFKNDIIQKITTINELRDFIDFKYDKYILKPNAYNLIPEVSKKLADDVIRDFIYKMTYKLGGMIVNFPDIKFDYNGKVHSNLIHFIIDDKNYFTVQNSIEHGFSKYGVFFHRYPTTFHNAVIHGEKVSMPSEVKIKKLLNG